MGRHSNPPWSKALVYNSYFRTAVLQKSFDITFSYKHSNFSRSCLLIKMASKTVTRSINLLYVPCKSFKRIKRKLHARKLREINRTHFRDWKVEEQIAERSVYNNFTCQKFHRKYATSDIRKRNSLHRKVWINHVQLTTGTTISLSLKSLT